MKSPVFTPCKSACPPFSSSPKYWRAGNSGVGTKFSRGTCAVGKNVKVANQNNLVLDGWNRSDSSYFVTDTKKSHPAVTFWFFAILPSFQNFNFLGFLLLLWFLFACLLLLLLEKVPEAFLVAISCWTLDWASLHSDIERQMKKWRMTFTA